MEKRAPLTAAKNRQRTELATRPRRHQLAENETGAEAIHHDPRSLV